MGAGSLRGFQPFLYGATGGLRQRVAQLIILGKPAAGCFAGLSILITGVRTGCIGLVTRAKTPHITDRERIQYLLCLFTQGTTSDCR